MNIQRSRTLPHIPPQTVADSTTNSATNTNSATPAAKDNGAKFSSTNQALARLGKQQPPAAGEATANKQVLRFDEIQITPDKKTSEPAPSEPPPATKSLGLPLLDGLLNGDPKVIEELRRAAADGKLAVLPLARDLALLGREDIDLSQIFDLNKIAQDMNKAYGGDVDAWARTQKALGGHEPTAEEKKKFGENPVTNWLSNERQMQLNGQPTRPEEHIKRGEQIQDALKKAQNGDMSGLDALGEKTVRPGAGGGTGGLGVDLGLGDMIPSSDVAIPGVGTLRPKGGGESTTQATSATGGGKTASSASTTDATTGGGTSNLGLGDRPARTDDTGGSKPSSSGSSAASSSSTSASNSADAAGGAKGEKAGSTDRKALGDVHSNSGDGDWKDGKAYLNGNGSVTVEYEDGTTKQFPDEATYHQSAPGTSYGNTTVEVEKPKDDSSTEYRDLESVGYDGTGATNAFVETRLVRASGDRATPPGEENPVLGIGPGDTVNAATNPYVDLDQALQTTGTLNRHAPPVDPHRDPNASAGPPATQDDPRTQERR